MVHVQSREEKDAKTIVIARALAIFVLVLGLAVLGIVAASKLGMGASDGVFPVFVGLAALLSVAFVVRRRDR